MNAKDAEPGDAAVTISVGAPTATASMDEVFDVLIDRLAGGAPTDENIGSVLNRMSVGGAECLS